MSRWYVNHMAFVCFSPQPGSVAYYHRSSLFPANGAIYFNTEFFSRNDARRMGLCDGGWPRLNPHCRCLQTCKKGLPRMLNLRNAPPIL